MSGVRMGMGFAPTWLRQVSPPPLLHKTTLTTGKKPSDIGGNPDHVTLGSELE